MDNFWTQPCQALALRALDSDLESLGLSQSFLLGILG